MQNYCCGECIITSHFNLVKQFILVMTHNVEINLFKCPTLRNMISGKNLCFINDVMFRGMLTKKVLRVIWTCVTYTKNLCRIYFLSYNLNNPAFDINTNNLYAGCIRHYFYILNVYLTKTITFLWHWKNNKNIN